MPTSPLLLCATAYEQLPLRSHRVLTAPGLLILMILASINIATSAEAQWLRNWNPQPTAAPAYHQPRHTPPPTVSYGGYGPPAQSLGRPGEVAWSTRVPDRSWSPHAHAPYQPLGTTHAVSHVAAAAGTSRISLTSQRPPEVYEVEGYAEESSGWAWQIVPDGLIYRNYLAGVKEPRMGAVFNSESNDGVKWDLSIGGRFGVFRYGTHDAVRPEGWQLDVEAAAQPRLDPEENMDLEATDYRFGIPLTYGCGRYRMKIAYFHLSSHLGDEYALRNGLSGRLNYSRDAILWGHSYEINDDLTAYGEIGWGFKTDVNEPWDLQFGLDYSPQCACGFRGSPFFAVNAHLREEVDFGGNFVIQAGWQWRSPRDEHLMRVGFQYYNGKHERYEFFDTSEQKLGFGIWYDF